MAYKRGNIRNHLSYTSLDGRNSYYPDYSHRIIARGYADIRVMTSWIANSGYTVNNEHEHRLYKNWGRTEDSKFKKSDIVKIRETFQRNVYYLNEDLLVLAVMMLMEQTA